MRLLAAVLLVAVGCRPDEPVRRYAAPKDPSWRMIAAVVPAGGSTFFLKAVGAPKRVEPEFGALKAFVASLKFEEGALKWTLPSGWQEEAGRGDRVATFKLGGGEPRLELTVTRLDGDAGGLLANVNRWRDQLGRGRVSEAELAHLTSTIEAGAIKATWVDLEGPHRPPTSMPGGMGMKPDAAPRTSPEDIRSLFAFDLPAGWTENPQPGRDRIFEIQAGEGAVVSLSALGGDAGGLAANVNRWRMQAGLEAVEEDRAQRMIRAITLLGQPGQYAEVSGRERSMIVAFTLGPPFSIFLKLDGAPEAVNARKDAFESFARSLRMNR